MTKGMLKKWLADNPLPDSVSLFISFEGDPLDMATPTEIAYIRDKEGNICAHATNKTEVIIGLLFS